MRGIGDLVKTCITRGFFAMIPILLIVLMLSEAVEILDGISTPIAERLPVDDIGGIDVARIVSMFLILIGCFFTGFVLRTQLGARLMGAIERGVLDRIPGYQILKTAASRVGGIEDGTLFSAALVDLHGSGAEALAFIVEDLEDDTLTVFVPNAPTPTIGTLYVVPSSRVTRLSVPAGTAVNCFLQWGVGSKAMLRAAR